VRTIVGVGSGVSVGVGSGVGGLGVSDGIGEGTTVSEGRAGVLAGFSFPQAVRANIISNKTMPN